MSGLRFGRNQLCPWLSPMLHIWHWADPFCFWGEATLEVLCSPLGLSGQERPGHIGESPAKGHDVAEGTGALLGGEAESWDCSAWRKGDFITVLKYLKEGAERTEPGSCQCCPVPGSEAPRGSCQPQPFCNPVIPSGFYFPLYFLVQC